MSGCWSSYAPASSPHTDGRGCASACSRACPGHVGRWQGNHARYLGQRKNLFDLRRVAVVHNLHVIARQPNQPGKPPEPAT
jgi:hypothetical protein